MRKSVLAAGRAREVIRVADLLSKTKRTNARLWNIRMPKALFARIEGIAEDFGASKTEVVVALINDGLEVVRKHRPALRL